MTEQNHQSFKIGIVGPSRVGKTSLIASFLKGGSSALQGKPISLEPMGTTKTRISRFQNQLDGSLLNGTFNPGGVAGNQESTEYQLSLRSASGGAQIDFDILDFPGGWITMSDKPPQWSHCEKWLETSSVLIIPIESAILMEATKPRHQQAIPTILAIWQVEQVVGKWAKFRAQRAEEPALLLLCPVKCESYFNDNGGSTNKSDELKKAVLKYYDGVLQKVEKELGSEHACEIRYIPVDTIGCVEIIRGIWVDGDPLSFSADYRVRSNGRQHVVGAEDVFAELCRQITRARAKIEEAEVKAQKDEAVRKRILAEKRYGFFNDMWMYVAGVRSVLKRRADESEAEYRLREKAHQDFVEMFEHFDNQKPGPRVSRLP